MLTIEQFEQISRGQIPFAVDFGFHVEEMEEGRAVARAVYDDRFLRPGGTVAGPVMMGLADFAMYAAVLSLIGPVELAVTTNLNCNFLRRPPRGDIVAEARILKLGKRLAVGEVDLRSDAEESLVAHVTATYSIPPREESDSDV